MEPVTREQLTLVYHWGFDASALRIAAGEQLQPIVLECRFINGKMRAGKVNMINGDFGSARSKDILADLCKRSIGRPQVDVVCMVVEIWLGVKKQYPGPGYLPSNDPERREAVLFQFYTKLYDCWAICPIVREPPPPRLERGELELVPGTAHGRFVRDWGKMQ